MVKQAKRKAFAALDEGQSSMEAQLALAKKASKPIGGCVKCDLCGQTSKDCRERNRHTKSPTTQEQKPLVLEERKWAAFTPAKSANDSTTPIGTQCYRCFQAWQKGFLWMEWSEVCACYHDSAHPLSKTVELVLEKMEDPSKYPEVVSAAVGTKRTMEIEVSRTFSICSERELKNKTGKTFVPKSLTNGLPVVQVPAEKGGTETCFLFRHPEHDLRECKVKMLMDATLSNTSLGSDESLWEGQAEKLWEATLKGSCADIGLSTVLQRETKLPTFTQWMGEKINENTMEGAVETAAASVPTAPQPTTTTTTTTSPTPKQLALTDGTGSDAGNDVEFIAPVVGPAAGAQPLRRAPSMSGSSFLTPPSIKKKGTLTFPRSSQARSSGAGQASIAALPSAGAASEGNYLGTNVWNSNIKELYPQTRKMYGCITSLAKNCVITQWFCAHQTTKALTTHHSHQTLGFESLAIWKERLDPMKVLTNQYDGRSVTGLERAVKKREQEDDKGMETVLQKNFLRLVHVCQRLHCTDLQKVPDDDLNSMLQALQNESQGLPRGMQVQLLLRRSTKLLEKHEYSDLLACINPFTQPGPFDPFSPCVSGVEGSTREQRMSTFKEMIVEKLLIDLIKKGAPGSKETNVVATMVLSMLDEIDPIELDDAAIPDYNELTTLCRALICLVEDSSDLKYQLWVKSCVKFMRGRCVGSERAHGQNHPGHYDFDMYTLRGSGVLEGIGLQQLGVVKTLACNLDGCKGLHVVVKELHIFKASIKPSHVLPLEVALKQTSLAFKQQIVEGAIEIDPKSRHELAMALLPSLHELSILCPDDESILVAVGSMEEYMAGLLAASLHDQVLRMSKKLLDALHKVPEESTVVTDVVAEMAALLSDNQGTQNTAPDEHMSTVERAWDKLVQFFASAICVSERVHSEECIKQIFQCVACLPTFTGFMSAETKAMVGGLDAAIHLDEKYRAYLPKAELTAEEVIAQDAHGSHLMALKRGLNTVQAAEQQLMSTYLQNKPDLFKAWAQILQWKEKAVELFSTGYAKLEHEASARLLTQLSNLDSVKGGLADGEAWTERLKPEQTWAEVSPKFMNGEVMTVAPSKLKSAMASCTEAT
eukprot:6459024-Amphidinium_carterae.3